ncbi:rhodanese-related sulfurtransferase [Prosthecobacter fusiformis]|uniref:Rhodanese-related sulfurtransferase n=1 Tax=Prosthecobacter fusiformis TaxID=48464 RepID=A0A4V3FI91_9BACT|nr:rhodanese-like domain-containing protein [Prosthecobacter fusiformis]TDU81553.1 rhodanese-related sulfurtransferase [Prosthecobacter fusiformis]
MRAWLPFALYAFLGLAAGLALLWWLMDHRRGTAWAVSVIRDRFPDVAQVSPTGLREWLTDEARAVPVLVDARSDEEYAVSHLAGALHVDAETVEDEALRKWDPQQQYVVYCSAGYRACNLARRLHQAGIPQVTNLEGGIFAWANAGHPVQRDGQAVQAVHSYHRLFSRLLKRERRQP